MNRANRAEGLLGLGSGDRTEPSTEQLSCNSLMHKNIHFGFNWCVASHLCSTQINSKSSKSRKFVCYEPLLKFPEHQFLCSVSVRGPRASRPPSMLGSFAGLPISTSMT